MRNNFTFLISWFPTLLVASIVTSLGSGVLQMAIKFIIPDNSRIQNILVYLILTAIICAALGVLSYKLGTELNRGSKEFSTGIPVFNMLICGVVYVVLYVLMKGRALGVLFFFPGEMFIVNGIYGPDGAPLGTKIVFAVLQFAIYMAVSLVIYSIAKKKQEGSEATKKLRGEKKKPNNRFGIDIDI